MTVILTDPGSDIWPELANEYGIEYIDMPYFIENDEYMAGKNFDSKAFYSAMREGKNVTTSSLNPQLYENVLTPYLEKGQDVLYLHFSGQLSGTFNHLKTAVDILKEKFPERKIAFVDTKNISMGAGLLILDVAKLNQNGMPFDELVTFAEQNKGNYSTYFYVDNLKYLVRGGRISKVTGFVGSLLNIKPLLHSSADGKIESIGKVKGKKAAMQELVNYMKKFGNNEAKHKMVVLHADAEEDGKALYELVRKEYGDDAEILFGSVGPIVGTHCGPGTCAVFFYGKPQVIN